MLGGVKSRLGRKERQVQAIWRSRWLDPVSPRRLSQPFRPTATLLLQCELGLSANTLFLIVSRFSSFSFLHGEADSWRPSASSSQGERRYSLPTSGKCTYDFARLRVIDALRRNRGTFQVLPCNSKWFCCKSVLLEVC